MNYFAVKFDDIDSVEAPSPVDLCFVDKFIWWTLFVSRSKCKEDEFRVQGAKAILAIVKEQVGNEVFGPFDAHEVSAEFDRVSASLPKEIEDCFAEKRKELRCNLFNGADEDVLRRELDFLYGMGRVMCDLWPPIK